MFLAVSSPTNEQEVPADVLLLLSPRSVDVTCSGKGMLHESMLPLSDVSGVICVDASTTSGPFMIFDSPFLSWGLSASALHLRVQFPMMLENEEFYINHIKRKCDWFILIYVLTVYDCF